MVHTAVSIQVGFLKTIACADIRGDVPKIAYPTLVITAEGSGLASVGKTQAWRQIIPNSELLVLPGNSYSGRKPHGRMRPSDPGIH
jgi:3-oxoadipate enol-lactonase